MGRDRLRKYAGVISFCKQLGRIIVSVHPNVPMDFGGALFVLIVLRSWCANSYGNNNKNQRDVFQKQLGGKRVQNS